MNTTRDVISDVLVIGGGAAGLTAALVLARARHRVTVVEDRTPRNATVEVFHGFPTRDGSAPDRFRTDALTELQSYGVSVVHGTVSTAASNDRYVSMTLADGTSLRGDAVVLATGVHDDLPPIAGLRDRWGKSVFNCPFCDGWEHRDQPVVVIDAAPGADHLAALVRSWTPHVTVVTADDVESLDGDGSSLHHVTLRDGQVDRGDGCVREGPRRTAQLDRTNARLRHRPGRLHRHQRHRRHQPPTRVGRRRRASPAAHAPPSHPRRRRRLRSRHCHPQDHRHAVDPPHEPSTTTERDTMTTFYGEQHRRLQDQFDSREIADVLAAAIVRPDIDDDTKAFIESRTFFFLSTVNADGHPTVSHKGGAAGFVRVIDQTTIVFPSYDGNGMFLSMGNIAGDGRIGLLFMDFERPHRIRAHAHAVVNRDDPMMGDYPGADLIVRAKVTDIFVNCPRYITPHTSGREARYVPDADGDISLAWLEEDRCAAAIPADTIPRTRRGRR